jgi:hypothetical protein
MTICKFKIENLFMLIGYARVSKADGTQVLDLQIDALKKEGATEDHI